MRPRKMSTKQKSISRRKQPLGVRLYRSKPMSAGPTSRRHHVGKAKEVEFLKPQLLCPQVLTSTVTQQIQRAQTFALRDPIKFDGLTTTTLPHQKVLKMRLGTIGGSRDGARIICHLARHHIRNQLTKLRKASTTPKRCNIQD